MTNSIDSQSEASSIPDELREIADSLRTSTSVHNDRHMTDDSRNWLTDLARRIDTQADRIEREFPFNKAVSESLDKVRSAIGVDLTRLDTSDNSQPAVADPRAQKALE